jgi:uncharacterized protein (TIGR00255 family)
MQKSMTGYGKSFTDNNKRKVSVEFKSVNSKSLDLLIKLPLAFREKEMDLRNIISRNLERGKIDCIVEYEDKETPVKNVINENAVHFYYNQLEKISKQYNHNVNDIQIFQIIMRLPEVMKSEERQSNDEEWNEIKNVFEKAISEFEKFRIQEGKAIEKDLSERINFIREKNKMTEIYEKERIETIKNRLKNSIDNHKDVEADKNRFEQELIYYLEKLDITEEKVRLENHCRYFLDTIKNEDSAGKKLVFISQEIGREINTLGAKSNHFEIQRLVVEMKDELEKIKEQLMNIL